MIRLASKLAKTSKFKYRLGAVITKGGHVISTGINEIRYVKENFSKKHQSSLHAEQAAIRPLLKKKNFRKLQGAIMFVSRIDRKGNSCMAKPCSNCMSLIKAVGIKRVIFTTEKGIQCI